MKQRSTSFIASLVHQAVEVTKIVPIFTAVLILGATTVTTQNSASNAYADELGDIFKKVQELADKQNYPKALEELAWAKQDLEKKNTAKLQTFLPDQVLGYKGGKTEANFALGMMNVEKPYNNDQGTINVSITGGSAGGGAGLGGLAQIGKMAALMGAQNGQETVRISGRTATLEISDETNASLSIFLDSGSILKIEGAAAETLKSFAGAIKIDAIDSYLKGS